ncbi:hypothetical protein [Pseudomonas sp. PD9R]|uniref:hypothetical protein n=1 Tax=Pseudomonas sp. PD9R TaxID=2853534 RepID=UPI001C476048|nr:hypothetical protein [Pseudomonas sp. PD9R]MBV6827392.1 hypothetical protein [Pseudomonas sp. PD9R]
MKWTIIGGLTLSGLFELLIDVPQVEQSMPVTCRLLSSNLADEADVKIGGVAVPAGGNWFIRDKEQTVTLTPKSGSPLAGLPVTLTCAIKTGLDPVNVVSAPAFNTEQTTHSWKVTGKTKSGTFQLSLSGKGMTTPITVAISKLVSSNLADEADVKIGGVAVPAGGNWFIRDKEQTVTLTPKSGSTLAGLPVTLTCAIKTGLDPVNVVSAPAFNTEQTTHSWKVTGKTKSGTFQLSVLGKGMTTPITVAISKLVSNNLADEADVKIGGVAVPAGGNWFFHDEAQTVTLIPKSNSPLAGLPITLSSSFSGHPNWLLSMPDFWSEQINYNWSVKGQQESFTFDLILAGKGMSTPIVFPGSLVSRNLNRTIHHVYADGKYCEYPWREISLKKGKINYLHIGIKNGVPLRHKGFTLIRVDPTAPIPSVSPDFGRRVEVVDGQISGVLTWAFNVASSGVVPFEIEICCVDVASKRRILCQVV